MFSVSRGLRPRCSAITTSLVRLNHTKAPKVEHLIVLPDMPNVLSRRVQIRPSHSPNFLRLHNEDYVSWAGPMFDAHVEGEISKRPFKGSVMVVNENSWDGFMSKVGGDPYIKEKIWDLEKTQFIKFRTLMRAGIEE